VIVWVVAVACTFTGGLWLIISAIWPAPPDLSGAVTRLRAPGRPRLQLTVTADDSPLGTAGRWALRHLRGALMLDQRTSADLELLRRPAELYAGSCMIGAVLGLLAGPAVWVFATAAGAPIPILVPLWLLLVGSLIGWFIPRLLLRSQADKARADFRHALGAYLDVLVMLLAAQEGPESAMEIAAQSGQGPAFDELRRAIRQARLSGDPVWDTLDALGQRVGVVELREIAAAGSLAGESGAAVRKSLTAKARSLRATSLSAAETAARQRSQQMFAPLVMMGFGFVIFLIYPLVTNISVGGT
jgi:tight adherence protein C